MDYTCCEVYGGKQGLPGGSAGRGADPTTNSGMPMEVVNSLREGF